MHGKVFTTPQFLLTEVLYCLLVLALALVTGQLLEWLPTLYLQMLYK